MRLLLAAIVSLCCLVQFSVQQQCDANKLCPAGCCSSAGYCGYGPDYCGKGCQSTCDQKSDCNPGNWKGGGDWSKKDKCPLNVCCSRHGFCGYTDEFCKGNEVKRPSCSVGDTPVNRVMGYYESWSTAKRSCYAMAPEEIPFGIYTHIIFSFGTVNPVTFEATPGDYQTEYIMSRIGTIKLIQPDIKILLAIGGWAFNDPGPTQTAFSDIAASKAHTNTFLTSLGKLMNKYDFDGVDIDWEYPVAPDRHGRGDDYVNVVTFMKKLRQKMDSMRKSVSMAIPASYWYLQHFDIKALEKTVHWFNLMTYDMHGAWDIDNKFTGPWANAHTNLTEIQQGLDLLWRNEISPEKITIGMAYYSRSFTLTAASCNKSGCRVSSSGIAGKCSRTAGVLLHAEIQDIIKERGLKATVDREAAVQVVSWDNQWTSFDDTVSWRLKANRLRGQCISSFMVWAISQDDRKATNAKALVAALGRPKMDFPDFDGKDVPPSEPVVLPPSCRWTSCFEGCPSGFKEVQRDGHKEIMMDASRCGGFGHGFTRFCCPSSKPPTCSWRGHKNSGNCQPGCKQGEVEVGTLSSGCKKNYQSACCTTTTETELYGQCMWLPCSTLGSAACGSGGTLSHHVASSTIGYGGAKSCKKGERRNLCCSAQVPYELAGKCGWQKKVGLLDAPDQKFVCEGACPKGEIRMALEDGLAISNEGGNGCFGDMAYCCAKAEPNLEPRGDDGFGSFQAEEFRTLMSKYMENPTCPATILHPPLHDPFGGSSSENKRSLEVESREFEILRGRAKDCTLDVWIRLLQFATVMFSMRNQELNAFRRVWDSEFAASYDSTLEFNSLQRFLDDDVSGYEARGLMEYVLYNPTVAGRGVRRARGAAEIFCDVPSQSKKRSSPVTAIQPRRMWSWGGIVAEVPGLDTILEGTLDGTLSLHYARWQYSTGQGVNRAEGPFLELAYWIGRVPGQIVQNDGLDRFRDLSDPMSRTDLDRWVVFHLHINRDSEYLRQIDGHTYMGIEGVSFFHGQWVRHLSGQAWRVRNIGRPRNLRDGFHCPAEFGGLWYVGSPRSVTLTDRFYENFQAWGERLFNDGYAASPALALIHTGNDATGEIDPQHPGRLLIGDEPSAIVGDQDPYTLNWLWSSHGYNFFPAGPPPGL